MSAGEKALGEIIGWEWRGQRQYEIEMDGFRVEAGDLAVYYGPETGRGYWAPPGVEVLDMGCWPNVDDMLAWLRTQERFKAVNVGRHSNGCTVIYVAGNTTRYYSSIHAETMQGALELAVRAIDEADNGDE